MNRYRDEDDTAADDATAEPGDPEWTPGPDWVPEWWTVATLPDRWKDAPTDTLILALLILSAQDQVIEYAPVLDEGEPLPARYVYAHLMQIRNLWNASKVDTSGGVGEGDFVLRPVPLDWHVKALLRPKTKDYGW